MPDVAPSPEEVRAALDELLGWQGLSRSPQLMDLLRYVVERTLAGEAGAIKAYSIAVDVFGRPQSFDPQSDPIVRVQARRLRSVLEQFYQGGESRSSVQIRLPVGRYVPEFIFAGSPPAAREAGQGATGGRDGALVRPGTPALSPRFLLNAVLGLCFTLIGVALAVGLVRWALPSTPAAAVPDFPRITVGNFDNLTGDPALDPDIAQIGPQLAATLGKFSLLRVATAGGPIIHGSVQENGGQITLKAILSYNGAQQGAPWSTTVAPRDAPGAREAIGQASIALAAQLGNSRGPLHAAGRAWLKAQTVLPVRPTPYVCQLLYMGWRDTRLLTDADRAITCLDTLLQAQPDNAVAIAADAGIKAWRAHYMTNTPEGMVTLIADQATAITRAATLQPTDSFIYEQQGLILGQQGATDAATGAYEKATELNPANMDAVAARSINVWMLGNFEMGNALSDQALSTIPSPPAWYYITRAFNALREQHYFEAIDAAQSLTTGDEELGPAIALAAAPMIGRQDIIERYRPIVLGNRYFQESGVLPRLRLRIRLPVLLQRLRDGLLLAGIPPGAIDGPFNPDGTPKS